MTIQLNHTIVHARDPLASASFVVDLFGLPAPAPFGPFFDIKLSNDVTLAYLSAGDMEIQIQTTRSS